MKTQKFSLKENALTEYEEQRSLAKYLDSKGVLWTATANGGSLRGGAQGWNKLKASGVKSGFPDILIFEPRGKWVGVAIELKRQGFRYRAGDEHLRQQAETLKRLRDKGWFATFGSGASDCVAILNYYFLLDRP